MNPASKRDIRKIPEQEAGRRPAEVFPAFDDPAFSPAPAEPPAEDAAPAPADPIYAGHPEFSQDAAKNRPPPAGMGNSEPVEETNDRTRHSDGRHQPI